MTTVSRQVYSGRNGEVPSSKSLVVRGRSAGRVRPIIAKPNEIKPNGTEASNKVAGAVKTVFDDKVAGAVKANSDDEVKAKNTNQYVKPVIDQMVIRNHVQAIQIASMGARIILLSLKSKLNGASTAVLPTSPSIALPNNAAPKTENNRLVYEKTTASLFSRMRSDAGFEQTVEEIPKAELHNHVCGSIDPMTFLQAAQKKGLYIDVAQRKFFETAGLERILVKDFMELEIHNTKRDAFISKMTADIKSHPPHNHEGDPAAFFSSFTPGDSLTDMDSTNRELMSWGEQFEIPLREAQRQTVLYTEFMKGIWTQAIPEMEQYFKGGSSTEAPLPADLEKVLKLSKESGFLSDQDMVLVNDAHGPYIAPITHLEKLGIIEKYHAIFTKKVNDADEYLRKSNQLISGVPEYRLLAQVYRERSNPELFTNLAVAMSMSNKVPRFRGITIAGQEDSITSINNVKVLYDMMGFLYRRINGMKPCEEFNRNLANVKVAVHAGEYKPKDITDKTVPSVMSDNVLLAAQIFDRIGHGTVMSKEAMSVIVKRNVGVELCPASSKNILGIELSKHPVRKWLTENMDISINTDDAAVNNTTLTEEWMNFIEVYRPDWNRVKNMIRGTMEQSFLIGESIYVKKNNGFYQLKAEFEPILDAHKPSTEERWEPKKLYALVNRILNNLPEEIAKRIRDSEKAQLQVALEMQFLGYEFDVHRESFPTLT